MDFYAVWIDIPGDVGGGSDRWYSKWSPAVRGDARMSGHAGSVTWQHPTTDLARGAATAIPQLLVQSFTNTFYNDSAWLPPVWAAV